MGKHWPVGEFITNHPRLHGHYCEKCGSMDLTYQASFNPNIGRIDWAAEDADDVWCNRCNDRGFGSYHATRIFPLVCDSCKARITDATQTSPGDPCPSCNTSLRWEDTLRCRYPDHRHNHPPALEDEAVTCTGCREDLGLSSLEEEESSSEHLSTARVVETALDRFVVVLETPIQTISQNSTLKGVLTFLRYHRVEHLYFVPRDLSECRIMEREELVDLIKKDMDDG